MLRRAGTYSPQMVKFLLPRERRDNPGPAHVTAAVTIASDDEPHTVLHAWLVKFVVKLRRFKFDENSDCIHIDFGPNARNITNDSFRLVCYV